MFYGMNAWFLASLGFGALLWVAFVSTPVWLRLEGRAAAATFSGVMRRGSPILSLIFLTSAALGLAASQDDADLKWAVGAAFLLLTELSGLPLAFGPGAKLRALANPSEAQDDPSAHDLAVKATLRSWSRWHLARCLLAATGVFFFIWAAH